MLEVITQYQPFFAIIGAVLGAVVFASATYKSL
jgi:hypothetical protein